MAQKKSEELLRVWKPSVEELTPTRLKAGQLKLQKQSDMFGSHPFRTWWFVMICSHTSAGGEDDYILFYFTDERAEKPKGLIWLPAGGYMVGKPTNPRRGHPHCLRLDIGQAAEKGTKEKFLLAADDVGTLHSWQDALMNPAGISVASSAPRSDADHGQAGVLNVTVREAKGLADPNFVMRMDPYATISYAGHTQRTQTAQHGGKDCVWDATDTKTFKRVEIGAAGTVKIEVYDSSSTGRHALIGRGTLDPSVLAEAAGAPPAASLFDGWLAISVHSRERPRPAGDILQHTWRCVRTTPDRIVSAKDNREVCRCHAGEVSVKLGWTPDGGLEAFTADSPHVRDMKPGGAARPSLGQSRALHRPLARNVAARIGSRATCSRSPVAARRLQSTVPAGAQQLSWVWSPSLSPSRLSMQAARARPRTGGLTGWATRGLSRTRARCRAATRGCCWQTCDRRPQRAWWGGGGRRGLAATYPPCMPPPHATTSGRGGAVRARAWRATATASDGDGRATAATAATASWRSLASLRPSSVRTHGMGTGGWEGGGVWARAMPSCTRAC
jgi:hypothetical protein